MRLVLDTNVVASALLWGGVPRLLLQAAREKRVELFFQHAVAGGIDRYFGPTQVRAEDRNLNTFDRSTGGSVCGNDHAGAAYIYAAHRARSR